MKKIGKVIFITISLFASIGWLIIADAIFRAFK